MYAWPKYSQQGKSTSRNAVNELTFSNIVSDARISTLVCAWEGYEAGGRSATTAGNLELMAALGHVSM